MSFHLQNTVATLALVAALGAGASACGASHPTVGSGTAAGLTAAEVGAGASCSAAPVPQGVAPWSDALASALESSPESALPTLEAVLQQAMDAAEPLLAEPADAPSAGSGAGAEPANRPEQAAALRAWFAAWVQTPWPLISIDARGFVLADGPACAVLAEARQRGTDAHEATVAALAPWLRVALRPESSCVRACSAP